MGKLKNINTGEIIDAPATQDFANKGYVPIADTSKITSDILADTSKITKGYVPIADTSKITSDILAPATSFLPYSTPNEISPYPVEKLDTTTLTMTAPEQEASDLSKRLRELNTSLEGQSSYRAEQEAKQGLPDLIKTQSDLAARLKAIQNEASAIPLQLQEDATGKGVTAGGLRPIEAAALRKNAIQALSTSSLLEASKGNLTTAMTLVDRAVAQKFDPIKEEIDTATKNLKLIIDSPEYSLADKNRAQAQLEAQDAKKQAIAKQEAEEKAIMGLATEAAKNGADALTLKKISEATTQAEALQLASPYMQTEMKQQEFENSLKTGEFNMQKAELENKIKQQSFDNKVTLDKLKLDREQFASDKEYKNAQLVLDQLKASGQTEVPTAEEIATSPEQIADAEQMLSAINNITAIGINDNTVGTIRAKIAKSVPGRPANQLSIELSSLVGLETLKNMGKIKGVLSDSDMALLKSASTGGLSQDLKPEAFKAKLETFRNSAHSIINKDKMQVGEILDNGDGTYSYKQLDGTMHTGNLGDNFQDKTVPKLNLDFSGVGGDTNKAVSTETIGQKKITASTNLLSKLKQADAEFFKATGKHIDINQSFRTREQQAKLYAELSKKGARVAPPGKSFHEKGLAIDVTNWKEAQPYLKKYGLINALSDDRGHFSLGEFRNIA